MSDDPPQNLPPMPPLGEMDVRHLARELSHVRRTGDATLKAIDDRIAPAISKLRDDVRDLTGRVESLENERNAEPGGPIPIVAIRGRTPWALLVVLSLLCGALGSIVGVVLA